jgi:BirA family biotin operon repressor/biotin-[acetyl-CoA-carboxylase] ligase
MDAPTLGPLDYERALAAKGLDEVSVFHRQTTGSTNDDARALVSSEGFNKGPAAAIVVAETQTQGRGRGPNTWFSPRGSIAFTITTAGVLPLGVGASVVGALRHLGARAMVKWPNDVLIDRLKVCGVLCESSLLDGWARVFIGIGINVDHAAFDPEIQARATSLFAQGLSVDRPTLVADVTSRVLGLIRGETNGAQVVDGWKAVAVPWWGEEVILVEGEVERRLTLLDVNPDGHLVARDEAGVVRSLVSGEVRRMRTFSA